MEEVINGILIREVEAKNIMTKSSLPVGGYSVNPYVGCTHACKYCYASFMKRFTGHKEEWGTFLDVKHWPEIKNPKKYAGQRVVIGSVTDGYNPQEEQFGNTRKLLEQLIGSDADILICTKSDIQLQNLPISKMNCADSTERPLKLPEPVFHCVDIFHHQPDNIDVPSRIPAHEELSGCF